MQLSRPTLSRPRLLPATILVMSALLVCKSVILVQAAMAAPPQAPTPPPTLPAPAAPAMPARPSGDAAPVSAAERSVLLDLRARHAALETRAHELDQREAELAAADRRLSDRVQQLAALQARLDAMEATREQHRSENWAGLVKIYEAMKPRDAAAIFDALDMQVLLQVLDRMQERRAAPVLAAMQPDRARLATQMLAELRTRAVTSTAHTDPKG